MGDASISVFIQAIKMELNDIEIRQTKNGDFDAIMKVEKEAFGYNKEARLVADLLTDRSAGPLVSLLAFYRGQAVGHVLFTRVYFDGQREQPMMHILAPLAVVPAFQRQGIGGLLIKAGIRRLEEMGSNLVFVLGHKDYYPRYGFMPQAERAGYPAPYPIPDEYADCWMVQPVGKVGFDVGKGKIRCSDVLDKPEHWRDDEADKI